MSPFAKRHFSVSALILTAGVTTGTFSSAALAMPLPQDDPMHQSDDLRLQSLLEQAREHMRAARWEQAIDAFQAALRIAPGNAEAQAGLEQARGLFDQGSGIRSVETDDRLRREQARAEFDNSMARARQLLAEEKFSDATVAVTTASVSLSRARNDLNETEFNERNQRANALRDEIQQAQRLYNTRQAALAAQELERDRINEAAAERARRQAQVDASIVRVRELQQSMKYDEAIQVVDQILFLDPINPTALLLRDVLELLHLQVKVQNDLRNREIAIAKLNEEHIPAMTPPARNLSGPGDRSTTGLMSYPSDWPDLTQRRIGDLSFADSEENRRVAYALENSHTPLAEFRGNTFAQTIDYLKTVTGINIVADWKALDFIGVRGDAEINLVLRNVSTKTVLSQVLAQLGDDFDRPDFVIQDGLLVLSSRDAIRRHTVTKLFDIKDLLLEVPYFDNAPRMDLEAALATGANANGNRLGGGGGTGIGGGGMGGGNFGGGNNGSGGGNLFNGNDRAQRRGREQMVSQIINLVQDVVDSESWRDFGGDTGTIHELNGNLVIRNTPRAVQQIDGLLSMLREVRALQINVEARFLTVDMNWFEKIGFDLDIFFNTNNDLRRQQLAVDPLGHLSDFFDNRGRLKDPLIFDSFTQSNAFANQVAFGRQFGVPDPDNPGNILYVTGPVGTPIRNTQGFSPLGVNQGHFDLVNLLGGFDSDTFAGTILNSQPALSLGIQFLDDIQVDLLIEATQADRRNVVLTAPRLSLFNGQRSWVLVGQQRAIVTALIPIVGDSSGAFQPQTSVLTDGVSLDIEAVVSADRRYVCMTVITGVRQTVGLETIEFSGAAGGGGVGGGNAAEFTGSLTLPTVDVALINTTTCVPDKGTILLGGQRLVSEVEVEVGVPILSKIPFINRFFSNRVTSKDERTLLILIRPEIIIQQENEDILFPGLSDSVGSGSSYRGY